MLMVGEGSDDEGEPNLVEIQNDEDREDLAHIEASLCALEGWSYPRSMKLLGAIDQRVVVILIDSRATHNFISSDLSS